MEGGRWKMEVWKCVSDWYGSMKPVQVQAGYGSVEVRSLL